MTSILHVGWAFDNRFQCACDTTCAKLALDFIQLHNCYDGMSAIQVNQKKDSNTCSGLMWLSFPFTQFLVDCKLLYIRMNPVDILAAWRRLTRCVAPDCYICHFFVPTLPVRWYHVPTLAVSLAVACPIFFLMRNKSSQMIWHPLRTT